MTVAYLRSHRALASLSRQLLEELLLWKWLLEHAESHPESWGVGNVESIPKKSPGSSFSEGLAMLMSSSTTSASSRSGSHDIGSGCLAKRCSRVSGWKKRGILMFIYYGIAFFSLSRFYGSNTKGH